LAHPGKLRIETRNQRFGDLFLMATVKLILIVAILGFMGLVGFKLIPPYFSNYQFEDSIKTEATQSTYSTRSEDDIREASMKEARGYDIALTPKEVHVSRAGGFGTGTLAIEVDYSVPIDLPGYSTTLEFHPSTKNKGIY
jgi:hypothetical protein